VLGKPVAALALALAALAACRTAAGPPIPAAPRGELARFTTEDELRAYLSAAARARPPRDVERGVISEAEGDYPYVDVEERAVPRVVLDAAPSVARASNLLADPDGTGVWLTRERSIVHARTAGPAPAILATVSPAGDQRAFVDAGLLQLSAGTLATARHTCGESGIDLGHLPFDRPSLRICGRLVGEPVLARVGSDVVFYGAFDALGDPPTSDDTGADIGAAPLILPSVRTPDGTSHSLLSLGPVYYPDEPASDLLVRVILRCDEQLSRCRAQTLVSLRSSIDALWLDEQRVALGFAATRGASITVLDRAPGAAPRIAHVDRFVIGLSGLSDGRLAIIQVDRTVRYPNANAQPRLATLDATGRLVEGPPLPRASTGRDGSWTWLIRNDRFIYGPARTHNVGGADRPQLIVVPVPSGPPDIQPLTTSADTIDVTGDHALVLGATDKGVRTLASRSLTATGPWTEHAYSKPWSIDNPGWEQAGRAFFVTLDGRRLVIVPAADSTYSARYRLALLEPTPTGVRILSDVALPSATIVSTASLVDDDRLAVLALGSRLLLRGPAELLLLELDATAAREVARLPLCAIRC
jgi:hypothetical protein